MKDTDPTKERLLFWVLLGCAALLVFWRLGELPLLDDDEPVYGEVGKEMARAAFAGWLTPHYNGALWFDKPPLFYWLTASSMHLFGVSEWTARLPSALLGIALVVLTYGIARRAYPQSPQTAWWSGFVLLTCVQFFLLSRAAVTDMTLAVTLTAAFAAVYFWVATGRRRWILAAGIMTGLAMLAKGPVALVLIGAQILLFLLITRHAKRLLTPALWAGLALCLVCALPWYLVMIHLHGSLFVQGFLEANNVTRFLQPEHKETQRVYFYVPVLIAFFLPWTLALPETIAGAVRQARAELQIAADPKPTMFLGLWVILVFVFFSASQTKLVTYIFPLYPALAILVGYFIAERVRISQPDRTGWAFAALFALLAAALGIVGHRYHVDTLTLGLWVTVLVAAAVGSVVLPPGASRWIMPGTAMALTLLIGWSSPTWNKRETDVSARDAAWAASAATPVEGTIDSLGLKRPSLVYYSNRRVIYEDDRRRTLADLTASPSRVCVMKPEVLDELRHKYGLKLYHELYRSDKAVVIVAPPKDGSS